MAKRYVLLIADGELSEDDVKKLARILGQAHPDSKLILVRDNRLAVIVKTTNQEAPLLRERSANITLGERRLVPVLTSGAIGKLKRRAAESGTTENGKVPER